MYVSCERLNQELLNQEMVSHPDTGINHVARAVSRIDSERARAWTKEDEDYVKDLIRKKAAFSHLQKSLSSVFLDLFEII